MIILLTDQTILKQNFY